MDDRAGSVTKVQIFNHSYDVRSGDPEYVQKLAELLDQKMKEVAELTPTVDTLKVAILAALNLADECLTVRHELEQVNEDLTAQVERIVERLSGLSEESH
jgi:cell division protein ZapA